jgi:UDP-GlcNAc:undecaprenyl-phosphate/decaprenyl-phosphate GlcNAc-1-phosphate transferase
VREYLITLLVAATVTYLATPLARRFAIRAGAMGRVRDRDVHTIPTPRLGGAAMLLGMAAALLVASRLPTLQAINQRFSEPRALLLGGGIVFLFGAIDDRFNLDAVTKLAGQILAAAVVVLQGVQLLWLPIPGAGTLILGQDWSVILTVTFIVVVINAVNFIDGLDGLAAGIVGIGALAFFAQAYHLSVQSHSPRAVPPMLIAVVVAGICVGFLPHNFHPARVFMGDSGSMLIGVLLAAATTSASGKIPVVVDSPRYYLASLAPVIVFAAVLFVPVLDLAMAVVRRTRAGMSPFSPDKMHLHHRLLEIGHSQRRAVLLIYLWAGVLAFGAVALTFITDAVVVLWTVGFGLLLAALASAVPRMRHRV